MVTENIELDGDLNSELFKEKIRSLTGNFRAWEDSNKITILGRVMDIFWSHT